MPDETLIMELRQARASARIAKEKLARTCASRIGVHEILVLDARVALDGLMDSVNAIDRMIAREEGSLV